MAEHVTWGAVAYLLSIVFAEERKKKTLYIWQLAATKRGVQIGAIDSVLLALRKFVHRNHVQRVLFTVSPKSSELRAIRRYAYSLSGRGVKPGAVLPSTVARNEREYVIQVV